MSEEQIVLVDRNDVAIGTAGKMEAHRSGRLHRAFSIFVFNAQGSTLLQKRAPHKYHSPGLWSNTCCSHPRPGESLLAAAHRRLPQEMGFDCSLEAAGSFIYRVQLDHGLYEHEYDHVFVGRFDGTPQPDPAEVSHCRWSSLSELANDVQRRPHRYTAWLPFALSLFAARR